ncbi:PRC-barrel domain-containing protein (plasmid) [Gemmobacter fulvus]|uniref:PRC-barrel domain-containing protein n=1 Tax=Gemmobacter fulvus TaxID=2840474 RepID=A0A975S3P7_9RHOB|nr:PRC-barrel domain-containing protein [Gemmobacter fulvus]MBT9246536.1 PRC-barrel domain-containing protein [Gemmobacter fulvus]QWK92631.1 PRC-barrel domain-containing protein [Gemmobacter fulvus]
MKKLLLSTAVIMSAALGAGSAAMAQDAVSPFRADADATLISASDFIGKRLYALEAEGTLTDAEGVQADWQDIGEVNDVILARDGSVDSVLVDIGGFLGMGERQVAVDMQAIRFVNDASTADMPNDYFLVMNAGRAVLEGAPEYKWDSAMTDAPAAAPAETAPADTATTEAAPATTPEAAAPVREPLKRDGFAALDTMTLTSEDLTGASVYDSSDARIGEISKLLLSDDGKLTEAVIDVGGFLGIGEKPVALPIGSVDILRQTEGNETRVYVPMTKEELEALPKFEG